MLKNMTLKEALTSKAILSGLGMFVFGGYLAYKGEFQLAASQIGIGLGIIGVRDAQNKE